MNVDVRKWLNKRQTARHGGVIAKRRLLKLGLKEMTGPAMRCVKCRWLIGTRDPAKAVFVFTGDKCVGEVCDACVAADSKNLVRKAAGPP